LILKSGKVLASGEKIQTLTAKNLSNAFGAKLKVSFKQGRFAMRVLPRSGRVV
jgi:ABC-type cobalamin transport system ATPase subunit